MGGQGVNIWEGEAPAEPNACPHASRRVPLAPPVLFPIEGLHRIVEVGLPTDYTFVHACLSSPPKREMQNKVVRTIIEQFVLPSFSSQPLPYRTRRLRVTKKTRGQLSFFHAAINQVHTIR